jgi:hypothetical protein
MQCRLRQRRHKWIAGSDRKESLIAVGKKLYHGLIRFSFIFHLIFVDIWTPWVILIIFIRSKIRLLHYPYPYNITSLNFIHYIFMRKSSEGEMVDEPQTPFMLARKRETTS